MKRIASMLVGLAALAAAPAMAADIPLKYVPPAPPPIFSWSGCYVGVHVGAGWQTSDFTGGEVVADTLLPVGPTDSGVGWLGGAQAGCNMQWRAFVIGLEGEVWGSTLYDRFFNQSGPFTAEATSKNRWDSAISVRSGVAFDRAFVYGKLGAVWGKFDYNSLFSAPFVNTTVTGSATITGVLIGVGFEYALTDNWTTKFEYNYIDYGNKIVEFTETECDTILGCATGTFRQTVKERKQLAKLGINYKFGYVGKDPVVRARY
jgi:outer membrane immunogenic protein